MDLSLLITGTNKNNRFIGSLSNDSDEEYRLAYKKENGTIPRYQIQMDVGGN